MNLSYIKLFSNLSLLKNIWIEKLDDFKNVERVINPRKILHLTIDIVSTDPSFLKLFSNLRELIISVSCENIDFQLFLPDMKALSTLRIGFNKICNPKLVSKIYNYCR